MSDDNEVSVQQLRQRTVILTNEFEFVKREHEAGRMPYEEALARHKAIGTEMRAVANEMAAVTMEQHFIADDTAARLVPRTSNPTPPDSN